MLLARGLHALGVRRRDHVGILLTSGVTFVETMFAVALCGGISVLLNTRYRAPELAYVAGNADLAVIVTSDERSEHVNHVQRLQEALPGLAAASGELDLAGAPKLRRIVLLGQRNVPGFVDEASFLAGAATVSEDTIHHERLCVRVRDTCMILYTSGTSANPKGCVLSHEAVVREAANLGRNRWRFTEQDRVWSPMPLFHIAALLALLSVLDAGGTFYGQPHFDAGESLRQIERERVTMLFLPFVTFHQAMIGHPGFRPNRYEQRAADEQLLRLHARCGGADLSRQGARDVAMRHLRDDRGHRDRCHRRL